MNDPLVLDAFYVVWREDGPGPAVKHSTLTKAQREADEKKAEAKKPETKPSPKPTPKPKPTPAAAAGGNVE